MEGPIVVVVAGAVGAGVTLAVVVGAGAGVVGATVAGGRGAVGVVATKLGNDTSNEERTGTAQLSTLKSMLSPLAPAVRLTATLRHTEVRKYEVRWEGACREVDAFHSPKRKSAVMPGVTERTYTDAA
jgi:hypothetical protein